MSVTRQPSLILYIYYKTVAQFLLFFFACKASHNVSLIFHKSYCVCECVPLRSVCTRLCKSVFGLMCVSVEQTVAQTAVDSLNNF